MAALLRMSFCVFVLGAPATLWAEPAPLPPAPYELVRSIPTATEVAANLTTGEFAASSCELVRGELVCTCLTSATVRFDRWREDEVDGLMIVGPKTVLSAATGLEVDGTWVLRDVWILGSGVALHVEEAQLSPNSARMFSLTWHEPSGLPEPSCGATFTADAPAATAKGSELTGSGWTLDGYRVGPWRLPFAKRAHRTPPGLLPPVLRAAPDAGGVEVSAVIWGGLLAIAGAGLDAQVELGVGLVTQRRARSRSLRALATHASDVGFAPLLLGDVSVGGLGHVRGHVEHPSPQTSWRLRRTELGGFFRDWRRTDVGVALSGGAHALQVMGTVTTDAALVEDQWRGVLAYGTSVDSGRHARWTVDLEHSSERATATRHSTTVALGFRAPFGSPGRAWISPGGDVVANYGAVTAARGVDASTTLAALASVEAGLALEGRFGGVRHRLSPVARFGAELGGVQQRQAREGAPDYPFVGPDRWRWGVAVLEQSLRQGDFALELPVGVFADALGAESIEEGVDEFATFARAAAVLPNARVDVAGACLDGCERFGVHVGAMIEPVPRLRASYAVSDLSPRELALMYADVLTSRGHTALRLLADPASDMGFAHHAGLLASWSGAFARVDGRYGTTAASRGVGTELGWRWSALGWGVSTGGAFAPSTGDWAVTAGLSLAR